MGQKVNPHGLRVGVIKGWDSNWFAKKNEIGDLILEDYNLRKYIKKTFYAAGISRIEIDRAGDVVRVKIFCGKAGMIIGKGGDEITKLEAQLGKVTGKNVKVAVEAIRNADTDAQLVAENIAGQLERRSSFRRAMKMAIQRAMRLGVKGIKVSVGGRLNGADIARSESYHEGTIPLQTLRADIDYGFAEARTTYGQIGVKVWIYRGEVLSAVKKTSREGGRQ
ncbi:MAG: 30S ribosomal protein S3 [Oscillospiraceae bacterium]|nr:30S ribosomal protein S3 [Oscillospiraceae bacterium]